MQRLIPICAVAALAFAPVFAQSSDGKMTDAERAYLVEQLELSKKNMLASISGLTEAQWRYKPAPTVWSVAECAEHLVLAEDFMFKSEQDLLKTPAVPRLATANSQVDHAFVAGVLDRSHKVTAPEPITPAGGKFATPAEAAREFTMRRNKTIEYAKTTQDDLRVHAAPGPLGQMDAYQFMLLIAAHAGRHTLQIREVEANAGYPKMSAKIDFQ